MSQQLAIRLSEETLRALDRLVRSGRFSTRTEAIRAAVEELVSGAVRREVDATIAEGYRRQPDVASDAWLEAATKAMVRSEPW